MKPFDPALIRFASGTRRLLAWAVALGMAGTAAAVAQAVLTARALAAVITGGARLGEIGGLVVALAAAVVARAGIGWAAEELARRGATRTVDDLRHRILAHLAGLGPRWRAGRRGGTLVPLLTSGLDAVEEYLARYLPALVLGVLVPPAIVLILLITDMTSGIVVALTLPLIPLFMAFVGWYTDRATRTKWRALAALAGYFAEVITGIRTLVVYGRARGAAQAVRDVTEHHRRASMATLRIAFLSSMVLELAATLSVALVAVSVGLRLVSGSLGLGVALTVLLLAPEAYLPLRTLGTRFHAAADGLEAVGRVIEVLGTPGDAPGQRTIDRTAAAGMTLELRDVIVDLGDGRGLNLPTLTVPAGRATALRGPSGVGKSTALALVAALLRPDSGTILARGQDGDATKMAEIDPAAWRRQIAWCAQHPVILPGSIRRNLLLGHPDPGSIGAAQIDRALAAAAADFVMDLPAGLDTELGDGGAGLSRGQLQRLCLARTVLRDAPIVILDEPTAALDDATERTVVAGMAPHLAGRTVLVATHRTGPLTWADEVHDLTASSDAGRLPAAVGLADPAGALLGGGVTSW